MKMRVSKMGMGMGSGHRARHRRQAGQGGDQEAKARAGLEMDISEPAKPSGWALVTNLFEKVKLWVQSINV